MKRQKKGMSRMDGALEHMRPLGFSDHDIRAAVKDLLKVYGQDGWVFLEEAAYKILLDTLLEKVEKEDEEEIRNENENGNGEHGGVQGSSGKEIKIENENENGEDGEVQGSSEIANECGKGMIVELMCYHDTKVETGKQQDELSPLLNKDSPQVPTEASSYDSFPVKTVMPVNQEPRAKKREPCYGWINVDEDDDSTTDNVMVPFVPSE